MASKIIIGYDGSPGARDALAWALDQAARTGTSAEIVHVDEWPLWAPAASAATTVAARPDALVEEAVAKLLDEAVTSAKETHPTVDVTAATVRAYASVALIDRSSEAGLLVIGSAGHSAVAGLLGSVSSAVTAHARCPVVVVRGETSATAPVVAGADASALAPAVLRFAAEQAVSRKVALRVISTWAPVTGLWEGTPMATRTVTAQEREHFDSLVAGVRDAYPDLTIDAEAMVEHPAAALTRASSAAQLLVVGSRGLGAVTGMLMGSVSRHLLRHAACTLAVVHQPS